MSVTQNTQRLFHLAKTNLQNDLAKYADQVEALAVLESEGLWQDDSRSARESITGYSIGVQPFDKNFVNWEMQRTPGYVSPRNKNTYENFQPVVQEIEPDSDVGVILTMFVKYAEQIGGREAIEGAAAAAEPGFANTVASYLGKSLG